MCFRLIDEFVAFSIPLKRHTRGGKISGNSVANVITKCERLLYKEKNGTI